MNTFKDQFARMARESKDLYKLAQMAFKVTESYRKHLRLTNAITTAYDRAGLSYGMADWMLPAETLHGPELSRAIESIMAPLVDGQPTEEVIEATTVKAVEAIHKHFEKPTARYRRVLILILALVHTKDPGPVIYDYVDAVTTADASDEARDRLARALVAATGRLWERLEDWDGYEDWTGYWGTTPIAADGMLWLDKVAIDWLEAEGFEFPRGADTAREDARKRWTATYDSAELLLLWTRPSEPIPQLLEPIGALAEHLWKRLDGSPPNYLRVYGRDSGDAYAGAQKVLSGISWAIDGPGVVIGDDRYAEAPGVRYWPRTLEILPAGKRPHQQTLGAVLHDCTKAPVSLAVQAVQGASSVLGVTESKLALLFMLSGYAPCSTTLADLASELMPGKARIQKRDYERIVEAIRNMRRMTIALPNNTDVQLFDIAAPLSADLADRGQHVSWQYSRNFDLLLKRLKAKDATLGEAGMLAGEFLINVSAFMRFNGNQGNLARQYLAACAMFNDSQSPYAPPTYTRESWAVYANALSPATTQLLLEGKGSRADQAAKARDLAAAERDLDALADMGLIVIEGSIKRDRFIVRPTEEWRLARKERRNKGARIDPDR